MSQPNLKNDKKHKWCSDSEATSHIVRNMGDFLDFKENGSCLNLANGSITVINGLWTAKFTANIIDGKTNLDLWTNMLSIMKITDHECRVRFEKNRATAELVIYITHEKPVQIHENYVLKLHSVQ